MTAMYAMSAPQRRGVPSMLFVLFLLTLLTAAAVMQIPTSPKTHEVIHPPGLPPIYLNTDGHPEISHSNAEVQITRGCLNDNGPSMTFKQFQYGTDRFHLLCKSPKTGRWYDMIVEKIDGVYREITSFPVKDGTVNFNEVSAWLGRKGAAAFKQPLP